MFYQSRLQYILRGDIDYKKRTNGDITIVVMYLATNGPALSTRGNLARARARGAGSPRTVEHCYLPH